MIPLSLRTLISIPLCLLFLAAGEAFAQQLAPPAPNEPQRLEALPPHVPMMVWGHDSPWLQELRQTQAASTSPAQQGAAATEPEAGTRVIQLDSAPGSDQQSFRFRDITDRSKAQPEVLPMAERSRAVQEYRRSRIGKPRSTEGPRR